MAPAKKSGKKRMLTASSPEVSAKKSADKQTKTKNRLLIVDGNAFFYRAYYAIRSLSNSRGEPTNAIYGFVTMMQKLIEEFSPTHFAICFDSKEKTFRHESYEDYKSNRKPMPEDLVDQIDPIKEFCEISKFPVFEQPGYEADDLIGALAVKAADQDFDVFLVTSDKDMMQLISERIKMINPHKDNLVQGIEDVKKRYDGLGPEKVIEVMALMGDASDNIPGVPGIGAKTAVKLIQQFGTIENLIKYASKIKSKSQRALIEEHADQARQSRELVTIDLNAPLAHKLDALELATPDTEALAEFYKHYEFNSLLKGLDQTAPESKQEDRKYQLIDNEEKLETFISKLKKQKLFSFDTETTSSNPMEAHLVGMSFCWKALEAFYIPVSSKEHVGTGIDQAKVLESLRSILEDAGYQKIGQNIKYDWMVLKRHGVELNGITFDTMIASYLVNPVKRNHNLDDISLQYLGVKKIPTSDLIGTGKKQITMAEVPVATVSEYACEDVDCVFRLKEILEKRLGENELTELFEKVEMPLSLVLGKMEMNGVSLDQKLLKKLSEDAGKDLEALTTAIYKEAGKEFNINSPKQLSEVLFVDLNLPVIKRTKTGFSTDESVLEKLAADHTLPKKLLEFREKSKLKSTYLDALPNMVDAITGQIHTSYHQTVAATGRLSSSEPNLQNIPIRTEGGRLIRKAFVPREKKSKMISADYSQVELRILAHLTGDKNLVKAFKEDLDVHKYTATLLYDVKEDDVTREMRNAAKTINFSIIYGKTAFGLSKDLNMSVAEADDFIKNYFDRYSAIRDYLESQKELAREQGYLTTILGRRAYFPDINARNGQLRQFAERAAINAPIQGSAADLIKLAMLHIQDELELKNYKSLMTMQVHDELVFDVPEEESEKLQVMIVQKMENAYKMNVPLKVDCHVGDSWYKA